MFIPLFVAVDVVGLVVIFLGIVLPLDEAARRRLVVEATITAGAVGDFQIAGGLLLLVLSLYDLLHPELPLRQPGARPGIVPLGIPVIVGPAVLTTLLTLARTYGHLVTLLGFALNLVLVWAALRWAPRVERVLGEGGCRAITKCYTCCSRPSRSRSSVAA
jgi:multiple antibiotic resistance protein